MNIKRVLVVSCEISYWWYANHLNECFDVNLDAPHATGYLVARTEWNNNTCLIDSCGGDYHKHFYIAKADMMIEPSNEDVFHLLPKYEEWIR